MSYNIGMDGSLALSAVRRPVLRYYGGGWSRAAWTISHFPSHFHYCEPFLGSGSILLRKQPSKLETAGDLDGRVIAFFRVLRERPDELIQAIQLSPWHEGEYLLSLEPAAEELEEARRFFLSCWASIQGGPSPGPADFRWQKKETRRSPATQDVIRLEHLLQAAERLRRVQFLQRDGLELIQKMRGSGALLYVDAPYLAATRTRRDGYRHEPQGPEWHEELAALLLQHEGPALIAGYRSGLYEQLYEQQGWRRVEREQQANSGKRAIECLWLSPILLSQKARETESQQSGRSCSPSKGQE
jgi:DNA adenine methylase